MVPISQFVKLHRVYGPDYVGRFNLYTSINVNGVPPQASVLDKLSRPLPRWQKTLCRWATVTIFRVLPVRNKNGRWQHCHHFGTGIRIHLPAVERTIRKLCTAIMVILSVPFGLAGSFIFAMMTGAENNIYLQIALIMLIGLLCKNAILIVQYGVARRRKGNAYHTIGHRCGLCPSASYSDDFFALIIGLLPMMFAHVGANGNSTLGAGAVGGMLLGMIFQLVFVPGLFVLFERYRNESSPSNGT